MPSMSAGSSLMQGYVLAGYKALNLKVATIDSILEGKTSSYLYRHKLNSIRANLAEHLLFNILKDLSMAGELMYFSDLEVTQGIAKALLSSITEMKMTGLSYGDLKAEDFVNFNKGSDIKKVWQEYEKTLSEKNLLDKASLLKLALSQVNKEENRLYIIPTNTKLTPLEEGFITSFAGEENYEHLHIPIPKGLEVSGSGIFLQKAPPPDLREEENSYAWLYQTEGLPPASKDIKTEFFHAYGESNEVKEILRRIKEKGIPFDNYALYYTAFEPYNQYFYEAAQLLDVPITFGEGVSIMNTCPGRFFFALLQWIKDNYNASLFYTFLISPDFQINDQDAPKKRALARTFRSLKIGWGRDRYLACLERKTKAKNYPQEIASLTYLKTLFTELFTNIPTTDQQNMVDKRDFIIGINNIVKKYSTTVSEIDAEAKNTISESLESLIEILNGSAPFPEAILLAEKTLRGVRVGRASPRPGHLHLDSYKKGLWLKKPFIFIAGLDALRFPGGIKEDPILLDLEREKISQDLELKKYKNRENLYTMAQLLSLQTGEVTLSYTAFDTVESRDMFPSSFLLQVYRLKVRDPHRDYSSLIKAMGERKGFAAFTEEDSLNEKEWWLNKTLKTPKTKEHREIIFKLYPHLKRGVTAHSTRNAKIFSAFDGKIEAMTWDNNKPLSASQLETLSKCPFGYFLQYVLGIKPPEDLAYDPGVWLDPATRGILLHNIFEEFYIRITALKEKPASIKHKTLLIEIAEAQIEGQKDELPPPNTVVFDREKQEMLESCHVFLKSEEDLLGEALPSYFELSFGMRGRNKKKAAPIKIGLPSGKHFYLRGKIDRVDMLKDNTCLVLDYKTGSTYIYDQYKYYKGGRQLQHTLYAVAIEEMFKQQNPGQPIKVIKAGYIFPTLKGEGLRILRNQEDRSKFYEIMEILHEILSRGVFVMTEDKKAMDQSSDCKFCDYPHVCRGELYEKAVAEMLADLSQADLELLRRLRVYD